jgi:hypothetical protein
MAVLFGVVGFIIGAFMFSDQQVVILENGPSLGSLALLFGPLSAIAAYSIAAIHRVGVSNIRGLFSLNSITRIWVFAIIYGMLQFLFIGVILLISRNAFAGATIDMWGGAATIGAGTAIVVYMSYLTASTMNSQNASTILAQFLTGGVLISILTTDNPEWWQVHFSSLGANGGISGYAFNVTLIFAGLAVAGLSRYIADDFTAIQSKTASNSKLKVRLLQVLLATLGIMLACVGLFVYDQFPSIHNIAAFGMAVVFIVIIALLPWITPKLPTIVYLISYGLAGAIVVCFWLFKGIGYLNLTMFELFAAAIIFLWLIVLVRNISALAAAETAAPVKETAPVA